MTPTDIPASLVARLENGVRVLNSRRDLVQTTENVSECVEGLTPETFVVAIEHVKAKNLRLSAEVTTDDPPKYLVHMTVSP